jgi:ATPase family associated with various cellular activities (AAA)
MNPYEWLAGGALLGVLTSCWGYIKSVSWRVLSILIQRAECKDTLLIPLIIGYLRENYKQSSVYDRVYHANWEYLRGKNRKAVVTYEIFGNQFMVFWIKWFPLLVSVHKEQKKDYSGNTAEQVTGLVLTYIRGTVKLDNILTAAALQHSEKIWRHAEDTTNHVQRFMIRYIPDVFEQRNASDIASDATSAGQLHSGLPWYHMGNIRVLGYQANELGWTRGDAKSALDQLIFPPHITELVDEVRRWRNSKQWYTEHGIPWKRGWLMYGPPGTGKTALARAFAEDLDMPIFVFQLGEIGNHGFMKAWLSMQSAAPCIALIEDMDNVFHGRRNIAQNYGSLYGPFGGSWMAETRKKKDSLKPGGEEKDNFNADDIRAGGMLTFDCLLNMLDGVDRTEGIFTIITTNDITKIDEALGVPQTFTEGQTASIESQAAFVSTRPGRIDRAIHLTYMRPEDKCRLAERILRRFPEMCEIIKQDTMAHPERQETPCQFQFMCGQLALKMYWQQLHDKQPILSADAIRESVDDAISYTDMSPLLVSPENNYAAHVNGNPPSVTDYPEDVVPNVGETTHPDFNGTTVPSHGITHDV